jgi:hypothetical protein
MNMEVSNQWLTSSVSTHLNEGKLKTNKSTDPNREAHRLHPHKHCPTVPKHATAGINKKN